MEDNASASPYGLPIPSSAADYHDDRGGGGGRRSASVVGQLAYFTSAGRPLEVDDDDDDGDVSPVLLGSQK